MTTQMYYIRCLKHPPVGNEQLFWRAADAGRTTNLDQAGKYPQSDIDAAKNYYDNGKTTQAVPVEIVDRLSHRSVDAHELRKALILEFPSGQ